MVTLHCVLFFYIPGRRPAVDRHRIGGADPLPYRCRSHGLAGDVQLQLLIYAVEAHHIVGIAARCGLRHAAAAHGLGGGRWITV